MQQTGETAILKQMYIIVAGQHRSGNRDEMLISVCFLKDTLHVAGLPHTYVC